MTIFITQLLLCQIMCIILPRQVRHYVQTGGLIWQTRDIEPRLVQCWADVVDGGRTLNQPWFSISCLLGSGIYACTLINKSGLGLISITPVRVSIRGGSSFSVRGGGFKFDKHIFCCKAVEGPVPGEIFAFQRLFHAI